MEFLRDVATGHIHPVVGIVIVLSVIPTGVEWWRARARRESVPADR